MSSAEFSTQPGSLTGIAALDDEDFSAAFGIPLMDDMTSTGTSSSINRLEHYHNPYVNQVHPSRPIASTIERLASASAMADQEVAMPAKPDLEYANTGLAAGPELTPFTPSASAAFRAMRSTGSHHSDAQLNHAVAQMLTTIQGSPVSSNPEQAPQTSIYTRADSPGAWFTVEVNGQFTYEGRQCRSLSEAGTKLFPGVEWVHINRGHFMPAAAKTGVRTVYIKNDNGVFERFRGFQSAPPARIAAIKSHVPIGDMQPRDQQVRTHLRPVKEHSTMSARPSPRFTSKADNFYTIASPSHDPKRHLPDAADKTAIKRPRLARRDSVQSISSEAIGYFATSSSSTTVATSSHYSSATLLPPGESSRRCVGAASSPPVLVQRQEGPAASQGSAHTPFAAPKASRANLQSAGADLIGARSRSAVHFAASSVPPKHLQPNVGICYYNDPNHQISTKLRGPGQGRGPEAKYGMPWTGIVSPVPMVTMPLGGVIELAAGYPTKSAGTGK
ncbi:hypothetical protein Tdes44962_MAKER00134 [Teratosphaeria destructans]|uniref:Uncharacterized protein n=1 Tax=Teratosphaeria destructans TaxID=418781 RepID=A0A9W7T2T0_9PEZI|nr:hypothetical protein Tdes44962_MAKER00134 [Teratosphaeria destructans]